MNVVVRSLMATGLLVYAGIHLLQAASPPEMGSMMASRGLQVAFLATALTAVVLAVGLLARPAGTTARWKDLAALLAGVSLVVLLLSFTVGFLGVTQADLRLSTLGVVIAESVVLVGWVATRVVGPGFDEVDDDVEGLAHLRA